MTPPPTHDLPDWLPHWMNPSREWLVSEIARLDALRIDREAQLAQTRNPDKRRDLERRARFLANRRDSYARELVKRYPEP